MKPTIFSVLVTAFVLISFSCGKKNSTTSPEDNTETLPKKAWTFLLYDDADFKDAYDPLDDFSQSVSSNTEINYIVLRDGNSTEASYYKIGENHEQIFLEGIGEANMGDPATLRNFLNYAKKNFPAYRYIVSFYDHGSGWEGTCWDITNQNDNLTPADINTGLLNAGGADIVMFSAPCLMGSLESAYQMRNSTICYIGSEDLSGFIFWLGMLPDFDSYIKSDPKCSTENLAYEIISLHSQNKNAYGYGHQITMSALRTSGLNDVVSSFDKVVGYYSGNLGKFKSMNLKSAKRYSYDFCDFAGLLQGLLNVETDQSAVKLITETINNYYGCLLGECHGDSTIGSNGLNIYFPRIIYGSEMYPAPYGDGLDFKDDCGWGKLVAQSLAKTSVPGSRMRSYVSNTNGYAPIKD